MSYETMSLKSILEKIGNNEIYLPAIQRKFVWEQEQIERLFDSILRGYPIGTFLFWFVKRPHIDEYVFYKFLQNYHAKDSYLNVRVPNPELKDEIIGVLDGQQRLSSIYLALQGTYASKKPYYNAYPQKKLYINLLSNADLDDDNDCNYSFKFLTDDASNVKSASELWFDVRSVLHWDKLSPPIDETYETIQENNEGNNDVKIKLEEKENRNKIKKIIRDLHSRIVREEIINYFKIEEQELDNILKIFVRVNSAGTVLSKTDLLFSTIVANWEDGRDEIEQFISSINKIGDGFTFNNDFVMRNCLVLTDSDVRFRVGNFRTENVNRIKDNWDIIKKAIRKTVDLLAEFGFSSSTLTSINSVIPICYYFAKNGSLETEDKVQIKKYLLHVLLKNVFSGQGDTTLSNFRNALRVETQPNSNIYAIKKSSFLFSELSQANLTANKTLKITSEDIDEFLEYKKGASAFLILSLLYPNLRFGQVKFHQDHIHPASRFTETQMTQLNISLADQKTFLEYCDKIPNLQLMEGIENIKKSKTPFKDWLDETDSNGNNIIPDKSVFLKNNYIDSEQDLDFSQFLKFYEARKTNLKRKLEQILL